MLNVILYFVVSTHDGTPTCVVAGPFTKALLDTGVPEAEIKSLGSSLND